jgi:predicted nucleic acid-binding protein
VKLLVADSGPLIVFARGGHLELLRQIAGRVVAPSIVFAECVKNAAKPGATAVLAAYAAKHIEVAPPINSDAIALFSGIANLDEGETAALALAFEHDCPVLMDERLGRKMAKLHKIPVIGSLGVLLAAKDRGLIEEIAPILVEWQAWGYFIAPSLLEEVLSRAKEKPPLAFSPAKQ